MMPTIRERITDFFFAGERRRLQEAFGLMSKAYAAGPWEMPPEQLADQLAEVDPYILRDILYQIGWETLSIYGYDIDTEAERSRAIDESGRMFKYSPLAQWCIWLWTGWGLGDLVTVTPNDEQAAEVWDEFWKASRNALLLNADVIHDLSDWLLVKGEQFMAFYGSTLDGETRVRTIPPAQITEILTNPNDAREPWFYKREWVQPSGRLANQSQTMYYPDWQLFFSADLDSRWRELIDLRIVDRDAERADLQNSDNDATLGDSRPGTTVCILHIAHNRKDDESLRGWPILTTSRPYMQAHRQYMESRLSVAQAVLMFVRRKRIKSGSRGVASIQSALASALSAYQYTDTNPPAVPGSVELDNVAIETQDLPLTTGATHARLDNEMFAWVALLGAGLFPTSAGLDTARWATALEMDKAQSMIFERYQTFWSAQFRKMVEIVLSFRERYSGETFEDKGAEVSIDSFSLSDFPAIARTIGSLVAQALTPMVDNGTIPAAAAREIERRLWRISLQALGISDDLTSEELWSPVEEEEEPEPEPEEEETPPMPEEEAVIAQIAAMIKENLGRGEVGAQEVAEWALGEIIAPSINWRGDDGE